MSRSTVCWWCMTQLVGPGGVRGKEPLFFRLIKQQDGLDVRVHAQCVKNAELYVKTGEVRDR